MREVILNTSSDLDVISLLKYTLSLHCPIISIFFLVPSEVTLETLSINNLNLMLAFLVILYHH